MGLMDDLLAKAKTVANVAGEKAGEIYEVSKLKLQAVQVNGEISKAYELLGRLHYENLKSGKNNQDMVAHCVQEIEDLLWSLNQLDDMIGGETGTMKCHSCGKLIPLGSAYCSACGMKVEHDEDIAVVATEVVGADEAETAEETAAK